ncbi:hypothetical protein, partial [Alteromonas macleodii]|uniref:hypothetical protein n=1 Tax=Alteromonas macleodii TaxID=28108 RepID=UPI001C3171A8
ETGFVLSQSDHHGGIDSLGPALKERGLGHRRGGQTQLAGTASFLSRSRPKPTPVLLRYVADTERSEAIPSQLVWLWLSSGSAQR